MCFKEGLNTNIILNINFQHFRIFYESLHFSFTMDVETYQDIEPEKEKGTVEEIILRQVC